jgi:hypothetical protein
MQVSEIYISRVLDADSAFGARTDTGEQVFIPPTVTRAMPVVRPALDRLFRDGALAKALVYARDGQDRASFCMWAEEASCFVGEAHND